MKTEPWDYVDFRISETFLCTLVNADYSGLSREETALFDKFESGVVQQFGTGHWVHDSQEGSFGICEIHGLGANCHDVKYMIQQRMSKTTKGE